MQYHGTQNWALVDARFQHCKEWLFAVLET
jgi:hypothetical protein